jgi:hypothetical protein
MQKITKKLFADIIFTTFILSSIYQFGYSLIWCFIWMIGKIYNQEISYRNPADFFVGFFMIFIFVFLANWYNWGENGHNKKRTNN